MRCGAPALGVCTDNRPMGYFVLIAVLSSLPFLPACSPTFNWRDVRPEQTPLVALFPCKPDRAARVVSLGAKDVPLTMLACKAGEATFALAYADMKDAANAGAALDQWKSATLANVRARSPSEVPFLIKGASVLPQSVQVKAEGVRPEGTSASVQAVWFAAGSLVFQAAVFADKDSAAVSETFFAGLRLQ